VRPEGRRSAPVPARKDELMIDTFALPPPMSGR